MRLITRTVIQISPSVQQCQRLRLYRLAVIVTTARATWCLWAAAIDQSQARVEMFGPMSIRLSRHPEAMWSGPGFGSTMENGRTCVKNANKPALTNPPNPMKLTSVVVFRNVEKHTENNRA